MDRASIVTAIATERQLAAIALRLAGPVDLTPAERSIAQRSKGTIASGLAERVRAAILAGGDPLGEAFCQLRSASERRSLGAVYTPKPIITSMMNWAIRQGTPARVVDPGAGSGRYVLAAAERFPSAQLVAIELDPLAALLLRANVAVRGLAKRSQIIVADYRDVALPEIEGRTLFIGNPPYVRHHNIDERRKTWFAECAARAGIKASKLSGLHIHFFFQTLELAKAGDVGAFITSAEWMDVNYGSALRKLLADGLGGCAVHVIAPDAMPFSDATTTAAITCFRVGNRPEALRLRSVPSLDKLNGLSTGRLVPWDEVATFSRWSAIVRPVAPVPPGFIELGDLCRVSRGQVTGSNAVWIEGHHARELPDSVKLPAITKARELLASGGVLDDTRHLRRVISLPADLEDVDPAYRPAVKRFIAWAAAQGANESYVARQRRAWWAIPFHEPAPIVCTYMARRPPAFVRNRCGARLLNIAHGIYPRQTLTETEMSSLLTYLRSRVVVADGRTYAGGLTKFEPRELERIRIPGLEMLRDAAFSSVGQESA